MTNLGINLIRHYYSNNRLWYYYCFILLFINNYAI